MSEDFTIFLNAIEKAATEGHRTLEWYGPLPKEVKEVFGKDLSSFVQLFGVNIEVKPRAISK